MFSKFVKDKNGLAYRISSRFLITYPLVFSMIAVLIGYIFSSSTDEIKYDLRVFNSDIQKSINSFFQKAKYELEFQAEFLNLKQNSDKALLGFSSVPIDSFKAIYVVDNTGNILSQKRNFNAGAIPNLDAPWISLIKPKNKFVVSKFVFEDNKVVAIYAGYYMDNSTKIIAELNLEELFKSISDTFKRDDKQDKEYNYVAYIVDYNGRLIYDVSDRQDVDIANERIDDIDEYFVQSGNVKFSYLDAKADLVEFNEYIKSFIVTYTHDQSAILSRLFLVILAITMFVFYSLMTFSNIFFTYKYLRNPIIDISKYAKNKHFKSDPGVITEYKTILSHMEDMYQQMADVKKTLQDYKLKFSYFFEQSPMMMIVYDAYNGKIIDVSDEALKFYGYSRSQMLELNYKDISEVSFSDKIFSSSGDESIGLGVSNDVHRLQNGELKNVCMLSSVIKLSDKRHIFCVIKDMTDELETSKNQNDIVRYYDMFSTMVGIAKKDNPFIIINATENFQHTFGVTQADILKNGLDIRSFINESAKASFINTLELNKRLFESSSIAKDYLKFFIGIDTIDDENVPFKIEVKFTRNESGEFANIVYSIIENAEQKAINDKSIAELKYFKNLAWASDVIPLEFDVKSQILRIGEGFTKMLGFTELPQIDADFDYIKRVLFDEYLDFKDFFARIQTEPDNYEGDVKFLTSEKGVLWLHIKAKVTKKDDEGNLEFISGIIRNVTDKKVALIYQDLASKIFSYSKDSIAILDLDWKFIDVNDKFCQNSGYSLNEIIGLNAVMMRSKLNNEELYKNALESVESIGYWQGKLWNRRKNGEDYLESVNMLTVYDDNASPVCYAIIMSESSEIKTTQDYLEHIAYHDPLTKLPNRFLFNQKLDRAVLNAKGSKFVAIAYLDMDGFKAINDTYGHKAGDKLLTEISNKIDALFDERDMFARVGGDEFIAIIEHEKIGEVYEMVENMLRIACEEVDYNGNLLKISASIGVSVHNIENQISPEVMIEQADWAMYQAKLSGKNRYHIFDSSKDKNLKSQYEDSNKILVALERGEFFMEYQPEINLKTNEIVSYEALIRWNRGTDIVYPNDFLSLIKKQNVLDDLSFFTISSALKAQSQWVKDGLRANICVNLSITQLCDDKFFIRFKELLKQNPNFNPNALSFEIIDANSTSSLETASKFLQRYKRLGVKFILDDFASKSSSFEALELLPIDRLKADKHICAHMFSNKKAFITIKMIKNIANTFNKNATIKNLKDLNMLKILVGLGFTNFQGNFFARAIKPQDVPSYHFKGVDGFDTEYEIDDELFDVLKDTIALKEYASSIVDFVNDQEFADDLNIFADIKNEIYHGLDDIKDTKLKDVVENIRLSLEAKTQIEAMNFAQIASSMCEEILDIKKGV
ncbi:hypothetical protein CR66_06610 [Campylobacter mucosalis]|uniref:EAL domain-containing protein n=1 Tax=Campylobacter mucosalis TaxID=202 RepID=UPI0004D5B1B3|nr:EAL domain-containing protein [Campylobacter mucosalis]KEA45639.1 hypothetical protein CR66_06610 [Campylobacter mucosalis]QKF62509.1 PAS sensor-containing diguanylate cyclase/phosphodiesterase [Campylobacter mucosalis]